MTSTNPKVCILGTHHAYQYQTRRGGYFENIRSLIELHSVDLVAEEASGIGWTYAHTIADESKVLWKNVDLTSEERAGIPDINPEGFGTQFDFDLQVLREWVWLIRTAKTMKHSALLICGFAHIMGLASKFASVGFDVETHIYFDRRDEVLFMGRREGY